MKKTELNISQNNGNWWKAYDVLKKISCFFSFFLLFVLKSLAQTYYDYGFEKLISIPVFRSVSVPYKYPWAGGINNVQLGWMDCNFDGKKDLIAFEVQGSKILPFLWQDTGYVYCPQYAVCFPPLQGFMQLIDFDGDGKEDIFTYQTAGIKVYRNISDTVLKFELFTEQILSVYYQNPINLFCTDGDYVVIADMDGDGDMDILAFGPLGKYVEYHKNMSMERYGNGNHLEYKLESRCWGKFSESNESNELLLDDDCQSDYSVNPQQKQHRHAGSTMLMLDENGDGLNDLLLGDKDYPSLTLLTNGGSETSAYITQKTEFFPTYTLPVNLYSKPLPMYIDIDRDGLKDLAVSPFDLELVKSENKESVWFYKNIGTAQQAVFALQTKSFLQEDMIDLGSGAFPLFYDVDGDGLADILVGNYGYYDSTTFDGYNITCHYSASIAFYKNVGTATQPQFLLITEDLGGLREKGFLSLTPAMGDINGDGKPDILISTSTGQLIYLENNTVGENLSFANPVFNYLSLTLPEFAAIQLFDLDKDGLSDLIVGNKRGMFQFYKNTGTADSPNFVLQKDTLGGIIVRDYDLSYFGYATPCFFRTETGETRLLVGSEKGSISYYKQIDNNIYGIYRQEIAELFFMQNHLPYPIREGIRTALSLADADNDGFVDLIIGNYAGGLSFYKGIIPPEKTVSVPQSKLQQDNPIIIYPNPIGNQLTIQTKSPISIQKIAIYDMLGKNCLTIFQNVETIDVSSLQSGVYILKITDSDERWYVRKFSKSLN